MVGFQPYLKHYKQVSDNAPQSEAMSAEVYNLGDLPVEEKLTDFLARQIIRMHLLEREKNPILTPLLTKG